MSKRLKDHTDEDLLAEVKRRGLKMGKQARDEGSPIPTADPTRPGKDMHDPLEGDEISGLETATSEADRTQESDGEVGGRIQDDTGEDVIEGDQTTEDEDEDDDLHGEADAGQDLSHKTSEDSKDEEGSPV